MTTIVTRAAKGSALSWNEVDANFTNLNTAKLELNASGNLGIGTSSPIAKLEAVSNTQVLGIFRNTSPSSYTSLRLYNDQNSATRALEIDYTGSTYSGGEMAIMGTTGAYPFTFTTNNTERMRIDSSGNLLVGTTSAGARLTLGFNTVNGDGVYAFNNQNNSYYTLYANGSTGHGISGWANSTVLEAVPAGSGGLVLGAYSGNMIFQTGARNERMRIDSDGNVGIGTSTPNAKLDVAGDGRILLGTGGTNTGDQSALTVGAVTSGVYASSYGAGLQFQINNSSGGYAAGRIVSRLGADNFTANLVFQARNYGYADSMVLDASGNLGLGVTPSAWGASYKALQLPSGALAAFGTSVVSLYQNGYDSGTGAFKYVNSLQAAKYDINQGSHYWYTAPSGTAGNAISFTQAMTLDASGNLGVGTSSPSTRLEVVGTTPSVRINSGGTPASLYGLEITNGTTVDGYFRTRGTTGETQIGSGRSAGWGGHLTFYTDTSERMRIDSAGNVGIGTSSPGYKLTVSGSGDVAQFTNGTRSAYIALDSSGFNMFTGAGQTGNGIYASAASNYTALYTASSERMRITSDGNLLVGTTSDGVFGARMRVDGSQGAAFVCTGGSGNSPTFMWNNATSGDNTFAVFYTEATATSRGTITYNRAGGVVAYNTASDYRAKDILGPIADPGATIDALKVYNGKMKGATIERPMLIAHEAQEIVPYAVTGEKDAVNEDGTDKYQQMDHQVLIPLLIAEIQSLRARVAQLEGN